MNWKYKDAVRKVARSIVKNVMTKDVGIGFAIGIGIGVVFELFVFEPTTALGASLPIMIFLGFLPSFGNYLAQRIGIGIGFTTTVGFVAGPSYGLIAAITYGFFVAIVWVISKSINR